MCPSCEQNSIVPGEGVCSACVAMYAQSLGPDWRQTEIGQFLTASNQKTEQMNERIACTPTGYALEDVPEPAVEHGIPTMRASSDLDKMIEALVTRHSSAIVKSMPFCRTAG